MPTQLPRRGSCGNAQSQPHVSTRIVSPTSTSHRLSVHYTTRRTAHLLTSSPATPAPRGRTTDILLQHPAADSLHTKSPQQQHTHQKLLATSSPPTRTPTKATLPVLKPRGVKLTPLAEQFQNKICSAAPSLRHVASCRLGMPGQPYSCRPHGRSLTYHWSEHRNRPCPVLSLTSLPFIPTAAALPTIA